MIAVPNPGTAFIENYIPLLRQLGWQGYLEFAFGTQVGDALAGWYTGDFSLDITLFTQGSLLISDAVWLCPARRHATYMKAFTPHVKLAVWDYLASFITGVPEPLFGILHGTELPFLFGNAVDPSTDIPGTFTPAELLLSRRFQGSVGNFVKTGDPGQDYPVWTPEVHVNITLTSLVLTPDLEMIRYPPAPYVLPPPFNDDTRCSLYDFFFAQILEGKIDGSKVAAQAARYFNIWENGDFYPHKKH